MVTFRSNGARWEDGQLSVFGVVPKTARDKFQLNKHYYLHTKSGICDAYLFLNKKQITMWQATCKIENPTANGLVRIIMDIREAIKLSWN